MVGFSIMEVARMRLVPNGSRYLKWDGIKNVFFDVQQKTETAGYHVLFMWLTESHLGLDVKAWKCAEEVEHVLVSWNDFRVGGVAASLKALLRGFNFDKTLPFFLLFYKLLFSHIHSNIRVRTLGLKCALAKIYASAKTESVVEQNFELQFSSWREDHDNNGIPQHDVKMPTHLSKTRKQYVPLLWMLPIRIIPGRIGGRAGECLMNDNSSSSKKFPAFAAEPRIAIRIGIRPCYRRANADLIVI
jgi:hypothetical protein